jgi:hypothetical protein
MIKVVELQPSFQAGPPDWTMMNRLKERAVSSIKELCYSGIFKHPTGNLANSIRGYVAGNSVYIISDAPYAKAQEEGVRPHVMWYLMNKTVPIRVWRFGQSRLIFRKATLNSYLRGAWRHPGYEGKKFMETGVKMAVDEFQEELADYNVFTRSM